LPDHNGRTRSDPFNGSVASESFRARRPFVTSGAEVSGEITFEELYSNNVRFVWRTVRLLGVPESLVEDAVQDVFVVVHRRLPDFQPATSARAWLYQIARRVARDYRRRIRRKGGTDPLPETLTDDRPDAAERYAQTEAIKLLEDILGELDEKGREILVFTELEELKPPELSQLLGVPLNTIYSRLRRARIAFNEALERRRGQP
jgi:RNA polymerase sigma-70 factor (ECF subfamily)